MQLVQSQDSLDLVTVEEVMALLGLDAEALLMALGAYEVISTVGELFFRVERAQHQGAFVIPRDEALKRGRMMWKRIREQLGLHDKNYDFEMFGFHSGDPRELIPRLALLVANALGIAPNTLTCLLAAALLIHPPVSSLS